jgi:hypothetical protein
MKFAQNQNMFEVNVNIINLFHIGIFYVFIFREMLVCCSVAIITLPYNMALKSSAAMKYR